MDERDHGEDWRRAFFPDEPSFELGKDINETRVIHPLGKAEAFKKQHLKTTFRLGRQSIMVCDQVLWPHLGDCVATSCGRDPQFFEDNGPSPQ